jgi:hypothetical protein
MAAGVDTSGEKKFRIDIGGKTAFVEVISLKNDICAVEFDGQEPIFITKIRDKNNEPCWVSIPRGNDELATAIGKYIDERLRMEGTSQRGDG